LRLPNVLQGPETILGGGDAFVEALHPPTQFAVVELAAGNDVRRRLLFGSRPRRQHLLRPAIATRRQDLPGAHEEGRVPFVGEGVVRVGCRRSRERVRRGRGHASHTGQRGGADDVACSGRRVVVVAVLAAAGDGGRLLVFRRVEEAAVAGVDEVRHPEVSHGVLESLAVGVAVELLGVLLHPRPPVVFDLVVRTPRQVLRDLGPPDYRRSIKGESQLIN
jgi:hypothetical protein